MVVMVVTTIGPAVSRPNFHAGVAAALYDPAALVQHSPAVVSGAAAAVSVAEVQNGVAIPAAVCAVAPT